MITRPLEVQLQSYWHVGAGRGGGPGLDSTVRRTPAGLPLVPGRSLKGLLRAAAREAHRLGWHQQPVDRWFGTDLPQRAPTKAEPDAARTLEEARFRTEAGSLHITSAQLGRTLKQRLAWEAQSDRALINTLYRTHHQTALEAGVPKHGSLRATEVVVPLTLWAQISGPPEVLTQLEGCLSLVTALGHARRRGLGRVSLTLHPAEAT